MTTQMIIRMEPDLKSKVTRLAKAEGKNLSELVRELLEKYAKERDAGTYIDDLWDRIGTTFAQKGISESDIEAAISRVRAENA